jgi:spore germination protein
MRAVAWARKPATFTLAVVAAVALVLGGGPAYAARGGGSSAWFPYWQMSKAVQAATSAPRVFGTANLFWYDASSCSTVVGYPGAGDANAVAALRRTGLRTLATITGTGLTDTTAPACFRTRAGRAAHIAALLTVARNSLYDGIDLNYESYAFRPTNRQINAEGFAVLAAELCPKVRALGKTCAITVTARTAADPTVPVWDYAAVGKVADKVRVMAYDQHVGANGPGPIAGFPWVQAVMSYIEALVPKAKLELGVPTYGRDFASGRSSSLLAPAAIARAAQYGATITYDPVQRESTYTYVVNGVRHTVWFSGKQAVADRTTLAIQRRWAGSAYWAVGHEEAGTWQQVELANLLVID